MTAGSVPDSILSLAYGTATNPALWQDFCDALNGHTGSPVKLVGHDITSGNNVGFLGAGWDPAHLGDYQAYYGSLNPWMHMNLALKAGEVGLSDQALPRSELVKTEFYNDWLRHQDGVIAGPAIMCHRTKEKFVLLVAASRSRDVDNTLDTNVALLTQIAPHLARAITFGKAIREQKWELEPGRFGVIYVRQSGAVEFSGPAVEHLLCDGGGFRVDRQGRLTASDEDRRQFLNSAVAAMSNQDYRSVRRPLLVEVGTAGTFLLHAHVMPRDVDHGFPSICWTDPVIGAFVVSGTFGCDQTSSISTLAKVLGATPAEARLAQALASGEILADYADRIGIRRVTARNQLQALLNKTETHSQAQLVSLLLSLQSPLRNSEFD